MAIITSTSFKGTTNEALNASPAEIKASTKVTITDNTYTAANLLTILGKTNNHPVVLEKTAAGIPLVSTDPADLVKIIEGVNKYTGSLTATNPATAEQLNIIAKGTTGKVTATLDPATLINAATVAALKDVSSSDNITFVTAETKIEGKSDLEAFVALNKKLSDPNWALITDFKGTASELSAIKSALGIKKTVNVEITSEQISAADANALSKATGGNLTATLKSATVKATLSALKDIKATDVLDFTTTETTVNASDLVDLDAKFVGGGTQDYTSITTITENAKDVGLNAKNVTDALGLTTATKVDVKISGNISADNAATIAAAGTGTLTATIFPGTAKNLETALNGVTNGALTLTLTDETVVAGVLDDLTAVTTVAINANSVKTITAAVTSITDITSVYTAAAAKQISGLGNENVTITGGDAFGNISDVNAILKATSGVVTAQLDGSATALLAGLTNASAKDELTLNIVAGAEDAKDLLALDGKTSIAVDASAATLITGTAADVKKVFAAKGIEVGANVIINVTDTAASAADANTIAKATAGVVTATVATGTAAALNKALTDTNVNAYTLKISKGTAAAKDLTDLDAKTSVNVKAEDVTLITGTFAEVNAVLTAAGINKAADVAATLSGTVSAANANTIALLTTGKVTATVAADEAATLIGALTDTTFPTGGNAYTLTVNNGAGVSADAAHLIALDGKTSVKVKVDAVGVNGDYSELEQIYVTNKAGFANLGDEAVKIDDATALASQVNTIAKATKGIVTATVAANTADVLVANLKDASATDALTLTVNGASAKAADLNTLDGKTSEDIVVNALNVTGNIADLTKLYITNADNFTNLGNETVTISGTVTAAQADSIADETTGAVTATVAAATATSLTAALSDGAAVNAYKLTVNGATAAAADLNDLDDKTSEVIKVDAKEITGLQAALADIFVNNKDEFTGEEKVAVKITDATIAANLADVIADATSGVVTATIASGTAADLNTALVDAGKQVNAYTLTVTGAAAADHLKELDAKTSVVVNASAVGAINGSAADIKTVLAAKTITTASNVAANVDGVISAADANTISKATTGTVTATVTAATAAALKSALAGVSNDNNDALTLKVSGATATAADLNALDAKTSVVVDATAVSKITGNAADVKTAVAGAIVLDAAVAIDVSGTVSVVDANLIDSTNGVVTATIETGTAATLKLLSDTNENAYKLTVSDTTIDAADLKILDGKTSVTVNAAAIKNIEGNGANGAADVKAVYDANANKTISGLGNETVNLSAADDANASLVKAINDYTTGVITLDTVNTANAGGNFSLSQLGDLKGITGLEVIKADNSAVDNITISIKDLLAANDNPNNFTFTITSDNDGTDKVIFTDIDTAGWTMDDNGFTAGSGGNITFTNTNSQVITITLDNVVLPA